MTYIEIDIDTWEDTYKPVLGIHGIAMLETFGADLELVQETDPHYVWTWVDGGDYSGYANGIHIVNRMAYIICDEPWNDEDTIYVDIYEPYPCEEDDNHNWIPDNFYSGSLCEWCGIDKGEWEEDNESN